MQRIKIIHFYLVKPDPLPSIIFIQNSSLYIQKKILKSSRSQFFLNLFFQFPHKQENLLNHKFKIKTKIREKQMKDFGN